MTVEGETAGAPLQAGSSGRSRTLGGRPTLARRLRRDPGAVIMFFVLIVVITNPNWK